MPIGMSGKHHSEESIQKMRDAKKGAKMSESKPEVGKIVISPVETEELKNLNNQLQSMFVSIGYLEREISRINIKKEEVIKKIDLIEEKINNVSEFVMKNYGLDAKKTWNINWENGEVIEVNLKSSTK